MSFRSAAVAPFWSLLIIFLSVGSINSLWGEEQAPVNVVLVLIDDQGYGSLSCHGNPYLKTPNMDELWAESIRLTDFHVDPTCAPTRSAIMTGRYSHRAHVWHTLQGSTRMHEDEVTMADVFRNSGYRTALFGKWHLGHNYPYRPIDRGFDQTLARTDHWHNDRTDETYTDFHREWKEDGFTEEVLFKHASEFILKDPSKPFFVCINSYVPHEPWTVRPEWVEPYLKQGLPASVATYYALIEQLDTAFGSFRQFLQNEGLEENTMWT